MRTSSDIERLNKETVLAQKLKMSYSNLLYSIIRDFLQRQRAIRDRKCVDTL